MPEAGETDSHDPPGGVVTGADVVNPSALPDPPFVMVIELDPGLAPPEVAVTERLDDPERNDVARNDGRTVMVTGTVTELLMACAEWIVTLPL